MEGLWCRGMAYYLFTNTYATAKTTAADAPQKFPRLSGLEVAEQDRILIP